MKRFLVVLAAMAALVGLGAQPASALTGCYSDPVDSLARRRLTASTGIRATFDLATYYVYESSIDWANIRAVYMRNSALTAQVEFGYSQQDNTGTKFVYYAWNLPGGAQHTVNLQTLQASDNGAYNFRMWYSASSGGFRFQLANLSTQQVTTYPDVLTGVGFTSGPTYTSTEGINECNSLSVSFRSIQYLLNSTWTDWAGSTQVSDSSTHWDEYVTSGTAWQGICATGQTCIV